MQAVASPRAQPRVRFETVPREVPEVLPRLDVAVFVGFAVSGPLHVPVAVEDAKQYARIFGSELALAGDAKSGEAVSAHLGPSVRAFFANGGRRCWIIRVAGNTAAHNYFPVPGLVTCSSDGGIRPTFARARSEGSWSDSVKVRTALRAVAVPLLGYDVDASVLNVSAGLHLQDVRLPKSGDLLRLRFGDSGAPGYVLFARVESIQAIATSPLATTRYKMTDARWFADTPPGGTTPDTLEVKIECYRAADEIRPSRYFLSPDPYAEPAGRIASSTFQGRLYWSVSGKLQLKTAVETARLAAFQPGIWLGVQSGGDRGWLAVRAVRFDLDREVPASPPAPPRLACVVDGDFHWTQPTTSPSLNPGPCRSAEIVTFDITAEEAGEVGRRLADIGCTAQHARFWQSLPGDQGRYRPKPRTPESALAVEARDAAFPLASAEGEAPFLQGSVDPKTTPTYHLPLGMTSEPSDAVAAVAWTEPALRRDGLAKYDASLFLDPDLAEVSTDRLIAEADYLRHLAAPTRPLLGLHAALGFDESPIAEEATLIAVPDTVHRRWQLAPAREDPSIKDAIPDLPRGKPTSGFSDCAIAGPTAPVFGPVASPGSGGRIVLAWNTAADTGYLLEESRTPDFEISSAIYSGNGGAIELDRPAGGTFFFRIRAVSQGGSSDWSTPVSATVPAALGYFLEGPENFQSDMLNTVQSALLRMCAARGELFAVLGLPRHFRERECQAYLDRLAASFSVERSPSPLSYGAAYHPWLLSRIEASGILAVPPDGAAVGVLAARAAERGAWVAPANQPMSGIVALTPPLSAELEDRVPLNLVRDEPHGFQALRADTLETADSDFRLINVRRLLILIRRLARRHGDSFAFEPNSAVLQRLVQRRFDALLRGLYERGAFAGASPELSYQVNTGPSVNTPQSVEQGRFIVELRVRPSLPMEFITIRLVQSGDHLSVSEVR
jgi:hypothetical protein